MCANSRAEPSFRDGCGPFRTLGGRGGRSYHDSSQLSRRNDEGSRTETSAPRRCGRSDGARPGRCGHRRGLESRLDDDVISACRNKSTGVLRVPPPGSACKRHEQPLQWNVRGPAGPPGGGTRAGRCPGPAGRAARPGDRATGAARAGSSPRSRHACTTAAGAAGRAPRPRPRTTARSPSAAAPAPPSEAPAAVVLNEIDYDQAGADAGGFVELYNAGRGTADLGGLALVFVDGADGHGVPAHAAQRRAARRRVPVVPVDPQNGSPDGVALYDTAIDSDVLDSLSYEGAIERAFIGFGLRPRRGQRRCRRTSPTRIRSPARSRGSRTAATRTTRPRTGRSRPRSRPGSPNFPS